MKLMMKVLVLSITLISLTVFITVKGFQFSNINSDTSDGFFQATAYAKKYFDRNKIMQINIKISEENWTDMITNAMQEEFHEANVTINGDEYPLVTIRPKGNSSLSTISKSGFNEDGDQKRFSLKINFNDLNEAQTMAGLTQLNLNNGFADPSFMREYLGYQIFEEMGVKVPAFSYADVYINGEYFGLFLAVESILEPYLERNFGNTAGILYKSDGNTLKYTGDAATDTKGLEIKSGQKNADMTDLMNMMEALNNGEELDKYLDIDQALRYIATSTALVNFDSYQGNFAHNYYLYEQEGKFTILPWDLNMAFGGFHFSGDFTNFYIDEPTQGSVTDRPFIAKLLEKEEYLEKYHVYLQEIIDKYINKTYLESEIKRLVELIEVSVEKDPTALYTYEDFKANTSLLTTEIEVQTEETSAAKITNTLHDSQTSKRTSIREKASFSQNSLPVLSLAVATAESIQKQLNGEAPSTNDGKGMGNGMRGEPGTEQGRMFPNPPPNWTTEDREFQPPPGGMREPLKKGMMPPIGPEGELQKTASVTDSLWFVVGGGILLLLAILSVLLIPKRKWMPAS